MNLSAASTVLFVWPLFIVCVCVCVCVCTVGKLSRGDADCVESRQQKFQTPETHCASLYLPLSLYAILSLSLSLPLSLPPLALSPAFSLPHLFCFSDAARTDTALIYRKKSPQCSHGDLSLSVSHTATCLFPHSTATNSICVCMCL